MQHGFASLVQSRSVLLLVALAGILITALASFWLYRLEYRAASEVFQRQVENRSQTLQRDLLAAVEGAYTLREVIRYVDSLPALVFEDVAAAVLSRNPDIVSLEWVPKVRAADRDRFEKRMQRYHAGYHLQSFDEQGVLDEAPQKDEYFPVAYAFPRFANIKALGFDVSSLPKRNTALKLAASRGGLVLSEPIQLALRLRQGTGVLVVVPVYFGRPETEEQRVQALTGYVIAVIEGQALTRRLISGDSVPDYMAIEDVTRVEAPEVIAQVGRKVQGHQFGVTINDLGGRIWQLNMIPSQSFLSREISALPLVAALVGGFMVLAVCGYLYLLQQRSAIVARMVDSRTAELQMANRRLAEMSVTDPLTGLSNRRAFDDYLSQEWQRCIRERTPITLMLLDVDHFKRINDGYGHDIGDMVLQELAARLQHAFRRPADMVARYGGEEFVVIMPGTDLQVHDKVDRFRTSVELVPIGLPSGEDLVITVSAGLASVIPNPSVEPRHLIKQSDEALYRAKREGRNRVCTSPGAAAASA